LAKKIEEHKMRVVLILLIIVSALSCSSEPAASPRQVAEKLLALHGLLGKQPEQRSKAAKNSEVDRDELDKYFIDLEKYDKFTGDIYVGVIVGGLAREQGGLREKITGRKAVIKAGEGIIYFELTGKNWKINLDKTIPDPIKERAKQEKQRYDAAREAGKALL
jgi:hypothetical protein